MLVFMCRDPGDTASKVSCCVEHTVTAHENTVNLKSAFSVIIMLLHKGLTHNHSQIKPRLHFGESFTLIFVTDLLGVPQSHISFIFTVLSCGQFGGPPLVAPRQGGERGVWHAADHAGWAGGPHPGHGRGWSEGLQSGHPQFCGLLAPVQQAAQDWRSLTYFWRGALICVVLLLAITCFFLLFSPVNSAVHSQELIFSDYSDTTWLHFKTVKNQQLFS